MMARPSAPVRPAPPEAAIALSAALDALGFNLATPFQKVGNVMGHPDTLAAAAMQGRFPRRPRRDD